MKTVASINAFVDQFEVKRSARQDDLIIPTQKLYETYLAWCDALSIERPAVKNAFCRVLSMIHDIQLRTSPKGYKNIRCFIINPQHRIPGIV